MIAKLGRRILPAGLRVAKILLYVLSAPFGLLMTLYGVEFITSGLAWLLMLGTAFLGALVILATNFCMTPVALFVPSLWNTMGGMWSWLGGWVASGHAMLWSHIVKPFPLYFGAGIVFILVINFAEWLKSKTIALKAKYTSV
jgi:hypothetical protein